MTVFLTLSGLFLPHFQPFLLTFDVVIFNVAVLLRHYLYLGYSLLADAHARLYSFPLPHARARGIISPSPIWRRVHAFSRVARARRSPHLCVTSGTRRCSVSTEKREMFALNSDQRHFCQIKAGKRREEPLAAEPISRCYYCSPWLLIYYLFIYYLFI